jgi:hypothetical protein
MINTTNSFDTPKARKLYGKDISHAFPIETSSKVSIEKIKL